MRKDKKQIEGIKPGLRIPRPQGYTMQVQTIRSHNDPKQLTKLKKLTIEQWTLNNYQWNNTTWTLKQISDFLNLPLQIAMKYMTEALVKLANFFDIGGENQDWARAQLFRALFLGTENQAISRQQVEILMASQGAEYKAFISREVNGSIANLNATQKTQIELLRLITDLTKGSSGPSILINNLNNPTLNQNHITADQAIQIVRDNSTSLIDDLSGVQGFLQNEVLPNVDARTQDLTAIGIKTVAHPDGTRKSRKGLKSRDKQLDHNNRIDIEELPGRNP